MELITRSEDETAAAAAELAKTLGTGSFIALTGDLGAGKTAFTRGLARGLGITKDILSPTFTLLREYHEGRLPLYHFDVYRIGDESELDDAGFYDTAHSDGVTVCEWADLVTDAIPEDALWICITRREDDVRIIESEESWG